MKNIIALQPPGKKSARAQNDPKNGYPDIEFVKEKGLKKFYGMMNKIVRWMTAPQANFFGFCVASLAAAGEFFDAFEVRNAIF